MKSTGLFGKNSGRVGGVVYSNYRGQQIVRSYQPQVKNPNTKGQIAQRAKFKLVSQLAAVFSKQLKNSYMPDDNKLTSRNAWVKRMLKAAVFSNSEATLPIEEIILTNARGGRLGSEVEGRTLSFSLSQSEWNVDRVKAQIIIIAYTDGGLIKPLVIDSIAPVDTPPEGQPIPFTYTVSGIQSGVGNVRILAYAYESNPDSAVNYEDYTVDGEDATLADIVSRVGLSNMHFSETINLPIQMGV